VQWNEVGWGGSRASEAIRGVPRKPREELAGGVHHVYARGNDRRRIFGDDADRQAYLQLLAAVIRRQHWYCLAYCLMDNHLHLLIETPQPNLGEGMQRLHGAYGRDFNARHQRAGHLFQGRYGSRPVRTEAHLWTAAAYIAANPVDAGACARPEDWPWSSHAAVVDRTAPAWLDTSRLLAHFGAAGGDPLLRYAEAVAERCRLTAARS
jgi:putative transposase